MHASYAHVPEFLKLYQNLAYYTQQGMEKYNGTVWKDYFRSSNHSGVSALKQLFMIKQNTAFGSGYCGKGERKLQLCSATGHTIKTCTAKCSKCDAPNFCAHLNKKDGKWKPRCELINQLSYNISMY